MKPALLTTLAFALTAAVSSAPASVVVTGTRIVYPADSRDVSVRVSNNGQVPALVQSWVDDGNTQAKPEELDVPFSITPSVYRLDPDKTQVMRLVYLGSTPLPKDRETVYWLNVLEIPPKPSAGSAENYLQFAIKTRLKIFYRPKGLPGSADTAPTQLKWTVTPATDGNFNIQVENPTPFHVSFAEVRLVTAAGPQGEPLNGMVPPQGRLPLSFKAPAGAATAPLKVQFKTVNDYGGFVDGAADLR